MSKGSEDTRTPHHEKRRASALWCSGCGYGKSACKCCSHCGGRLERVYKHWQCKECDSTYATLEQARNASPLPSHPILDVLSEACGWDVAPRKDASSCSVCGKRLRMDDTVSWRDASCAVCIQCYISKGANSFA